MAIKRPIWALSHGGRGGKAVVARKVLFVDDRTKARDKRIGTRAYSKLRNTVSFLNDKKNKKLNIRI